MVTRTGCNRSHTVFKISWKILEGLWKFWNSWSDRSKITNSVDTKVTLDVRRPLITRRISKITAKFPYNFFNFFEVQPFLKHNFLSELFRSSSHAPIQLLQILGQKTTKLTLKLQFDATSTVNFQSLWPTGLAVDDSPSPTILYSQIPKNMEVLIQ